MFEIYLYDEDKKKYADAFYEQFIGIKKCLLIFRKRCSKWCARYFSCILEGHKRKGLY